MTCEILTVDDGKRYFEHNDKYIHWRGEKCTSLALVPDLTEEIQEKITVSFKNNLIQEFLEKTKANKGWFQFTISEATAEEKEQCADIFQRADCTHIMHGKPIEREKIIEMLKGKPYKITLDVYVPKEEAERNGKELP